MPANSSRSSAISLLAGGVAAVLLCAGCGFSDSANAAAEGGASAENGQSAVYSVSGMNCDGCEERLRRAVTHLDGVLAVNASFQNSQLVVSIDPSKVRPETIESHVERLGYELVLNDDASTSEAGAESLDDVVF